MIISISGKLSSGKDLTGTIIQYLLDHRINTTNPEARDEDGDLTFMSFDTWVEKGYRQYSNWHIKKFAYKLKEICSILTGIPAIGFEDEGVKNNVMPACFQMYKILKNGDGIGVLVNSEKEAMEFCGDSLDYTFAQTERTYRWLLQNVGTNAMRDVIHPNIWIVSLFADYTYKGYKTTNSRVGIQLFNKDGSRGKSVSIPAPEFDVDKRVFPNWIITDTRFPNELEAVKKNGGITIKIVRGWIDADVANESFKNIGTGSLYNPNFKSHTSETALDGATFDYEIENNGSIEELIEKVKSILIEREIL